MQRIFDEEKTNNEMPQPQAIFDKSDVKNELAVCAQKVSFLKILAARLNRARHVKNRLKRLATIVPSANRKCGKVHEDLCKVIQSYMNTQKKDDCIDENADTNAHHTNTSAAKKNSTAGEETSTVTISTPTVPTTNTVTTVTAPMPHSVSHLDGRQFIHQYAGAPQTGQTTAFGPNAAPYVRPHQANPAPNVVTVDMLNQSMQQMAHQMSDIIAQQLMAAQQHMARQNPQGPAEHNKANSTRNESAHGHDIMFDRTNEPSMIHNVTVVPYGQTPVSKWNIQFTGRTKKEDRKAMEDVYLFFQKVEKLMQAHHVANGEIVEKLNLLLDGPAHMYLKELTRKGINNWAERKFMKRFANIDEENIHHLRRRHICAKHRFETQSGELVIGNFSLP